LIHAPSRSSGWTGSIEPAAVGSDLLLHNGRILSMNPARPEATAVGIRQGRIVAIGAEKDVRAAMPASVETVDLAGRMAVPGLNDAHAHPMGVGLAALDIDLTTTGNRNGSVPSLVNLVEKAARARPSGGWIVGRGYDQARLVEQRHPTRSDLDPVSSGHPALLIRACHHIGVANSIALQHAGISRDSVDPPGGVVDRDEHGEPTGVVRESALGLVRDAIGEPTEEQLVAALAAAGRAFLENGVTSVAEAGIGRPEELAAYQRLRSSDQLSVRTYLMMMLDPMLESLEALGMTTGFGDDRLRIGPVKLFADGSIGGRSARMRRPYVGADETLGLWMHPPEELTARVSRAHRAGFQIAIHAIGDAAIELVVDAYEAAMRAAPRSDPRHRIEHCSIVDEALLDRIATLNIVPIPGTSFLHAFLDAYLDNLGEERVRYAYGMASYARRGIVAAASSDAPVVPINPMIGLQTMVTRQDRRGRSIWPEEAVSLHDALRAYTVNGAYASFEERDKGMLAPGMLGDVTVFDTDLSTTEPAALGDSKVDLTIVSGEVVYQRGAG